MAVTTQAAESKQEFGALNVDSVNNRLVECGRIACIVYGKHYRKLVCIVDFIDKNRVLVDGARGSLSNVKRISFPLRWLQMTKFRLNVDRDVPQKDLIEAAKTADVKNAYRATPAGRRQQCIKRKEKLNDFGRFRLYYVKGQYKKAVSQELRKLRAEKAGTTVKVLNEKEAKRAQTHRTVRRVVGKFARKLRSRVNKKQLKRKERAKRVAKYYH